MHIYKFPLTTKRGETKIKVPYLILRALTVACDPEGTPCLYAAVNPDANGMDTLCVHGYWTGDKAQTKYAYLNTLIIEGLVYHYFWYRVEYRREE
jgi:hypothetical protein